ncbi:hypothetical protein Tco_0933828 [Tanacetum coccineum]
MMSPRGSIMASFEDVESFLAVHTPPDHLIRTYLKQEGVVPKVVFDVFEKLSFLLGRHSFDHKIPRMVVYKIGKPWGIIISTKSNHPKCLERKGFRNFLFLKLTLMEIFKSGKVVGGEIFCSFFITDNYIKFLEQQNPPEQSWLSILLSKQVLES